uniref:Chemosensory protein 11 n=1 Tax=Cyrtorhinus lividipennis TaxID=1032904 RepID=A0A346TI07_9HEMI|nr:chemosensory protein 11 [Cyrtorhinus lividipennis]
MKILVVAVCFIAVASAASTYTTKYDNIDLEEILTNQRLYKKYFDCLTNKGKCTPDGKELKDALPDALKTSCSKCTKKQQEGTDKVIRYMLKNKVQDYKMLESLYDPSGNYRKKYDEEAQKRGIKLPK